MINKKNKISLIIGILVLILLFKYGIGIPCIFHKITGLHCPGCGMTRAFGALIELKPYQAIRYNALLLLIPLYGIYCVLKYKHIKYANIIIYILLGIIIIYGILRNIPMFSYLAPTDII